MPEWWSNIEWSDIDWGNVAEWVAAIGTVGTLLIAVLVLRRESADRRKEHEFKRSEQARQVVLGAPVADSNRVQNGFIFTSFGVVVTNNSDEPIHDVEVGLTMPQANLKSGEARTKTKTWPVIRAGDAERFVAGFWVLPTIRVLGKKEVTVATPHLEFVDRASQRWRIGADYRLIDIT